MQYDMVFQGGGARGMVFVGAYEEFVRRGHTPGRLLGTSAGAITATLIAAGYAPEEMQAALNERENGQPVFAGFLGEPEPFSQEEIKAGAIRSLLRNINVQLVPDFVEDRLDDTLAQTLAQHLLSRNLVALIERGGWYTASRFITWLRTRLDSGLWQGEKRQFSQMTLAAFFAKTQVELSIVAADTTDGRLLVLNHNTAPACPLVEAVHMSMSVPLVWSEVVWQAGWGSYLGRDLTDHTIVDGGILSNFPLELFISDEPHVTRLMGPKQDMPVLGLLIDDTLPVPVLAASQGVAGDVYERLSELQTLRRIKRLVDTAMNAHDKMVIDSFSHLVAHLPAQGYSVVDFDMSDERRAALVAAGRSALGSYFDNLGASVLGATGMEEDSVAAHALETADRIARRLLE